jgi:hypothetical protein
VLSSFTWSILFLPGYVYYMWKPSWHLDVYSWSIYFIRRRWDGFSTWVHDVRCAWAPAAMSCCDRRLRPPLPEGPGLAMLIRYWKPSSVFDRRHRPCPGWGGRQDGQTGGKILPARTHCRVEKWWHGSFLGFVPFRLVAPPLQPEVVGLYSVRGVWFPSHLPLEGTSRIQNFGP